jgi:hypothetical protein
MVREFVHLPTCLRRLSSIGARSAEAGKALGPAWRMDEEGGFSTGGCDYYSHLPPTCFKRQNSLTGSSALWNELVACTLNCQFPIALMNRGLAGHQTFYSNAMPECSCRQFVDPSLTFRVLIRTTRQCFSHEIEAGIFTPSLRIWPANCPMCN